MTLKLLRTTRRDSRGSGEPRPVSPYPFLHQFEEADDNNSRTESSKERVTLGILETDYSQMDEAAFKTYLQKVIRLDCMDVWKNSIQLLIDNNSGWKLEYRKGGLTHLIDESKRENVFEVKP